MERSPARSIARQQWRARIETWATGLADLDEYASPASNGGRGLKRYRRAPGRKCCVASPASNGGRGLKQEQPGRGTYLEGHRPPAMAGAD